MDLYDKKVNFGNKPNRRLQEKYHEAEYNQSKRPKNVYIQKMIPQNENFNRVSGGETIPNVRSSMEDIFSNEDSKKKAIKYVINIGKNKSIRNSPLHEGSRRFEKSASPNRGRVPKGYGNSYEVSPYHQYPDRRGESHRKYQLSNLSENPPIAYGYNNLRKKNNDYPPYNNNIRPILRNYGPYNELNEE